MTYPRNTEIHIDRRGFLTAVGAAAGAAALGGLEAAPAEARAAMRHTQAPYFHRFRLAAFEATVVSDGPLPLGEPSGTFLGIGKEEVAKLLTDNFLAPNNVVLEQNALVVNTGSKLVLFDSGMGTSTMFGRTTGRLLRSLAEAGIRARDIDAVMCTHGHIDHIGGLVGARGTRLFPKADIYISKADFDFWTDEKKLADSKVKAFIEHARKNLLPYRDRIKFVEDGKEAVPGIQAMSVPGHTVGHTAFMISSEGKSICNIGDTTHHQVLLTERPKVEFAYDTDPKQAVQSRIKLLDMLASKKIPLLAYHFPYPGIGHLAKQGEGFRYFPTPMQMIIEKPAPAAPAKKT
jgi:glyoxylase-like metal-dependent hydrolase (beta-lactamase superfamily II)